MRLLSYLLAALLTVSSATPAQALGLAMQITNISDFDLGIWSPGDQEVEAHIDVCIYGINIPDLTSYNIKVSSSPSSYRLNYGSNYIPYSLYWKDNVSGALGSQLTDNVALTNQHNLSIILLCALGGPNARLTLKISKAAMDAALSGTYNGTLTLLLSAS